MTTILVVETDEPAEILGPRGQALIMGEYAGWRPDDVGLIAFDDVPPSIGGRGREWPSPQLPWTSTLSAASMRSIR